MIGSWSEVAARLNPAFHRLKPTHGLQDGFKHRRFDVIVDLGTFPEVSEIALLVRWYGRDPRKAPGHPLWPVLQAACQAVDGVLHDAYSGAEVRIPARGAAAAMPDNELDRVYEVPAEPRGPLADIDGKDWSRWRHAYGSASDIPALLRALRSSDEEVRNQAWCELYDGLYHEGSVYEATVHAVPYLLALLADASTPDRLGLLHYLLDLCMGLPEDFEARQVPWAIAKGVQSILPLAQGRSPLRVPAICLLATLPRTARHARPLVSQLLSEETDPEIRATAAYAMGMAWKPSLPDLHKLEKSLSSELPGERLAAALSMHRADYVTPEVIELFFDVLGDPEPYQSWAASCPWGAFDPSGAALDQLLRLHRDVRWAYRLRFITLLADKRADSSWPHAHDIARDLLALAFGGRRVEAENGSQLSQDERLVLLATAACRSIWQGVESDDVQRRLKALGLPYQASSLAAFVRAGSPSAAAPN